MIARAYRLDPRSNARRAAALLTALWAMSPAAPAWVSAWVLEDALAQSELERDRRRLLEEQNKKNAPEQNSAELGTLPELLDSEPAEYPAAAYAQGLEADVLLTIDVDKTGAVENVTVARSGGAEFDAAAMAAAKKFQFSPGLLKNGEPVAVQINYTYRFTLPPKPEAPPTPTPVAEEPASAAPQSEAELGPANLTGRVIEAGTKKPLVAVEVTSKATGESAFTDGKGYFELHGVPAGTTEVTASSLDYQTEVFSVAIDEGKATDIEVFLTRENYSEYELTVRGQRVVNEVTQRVLSNREIQKVAGTQGDTLKVIEALPGVARTPGGLGGLVLLRGTDQFASSVFVDNIPLPRLFHFGGLRSVMNSELVEKLQFYPGNASVKYGQSTGGSIDIITKNPRTDQFYGKVNLNVYEGGFLLGGPITEKVSVVGAFHRSWYDAVLPLVLPAGSSTNLTVAPRYYDYQLKVNWAVTPKDEIQFFNYGLGDKLSGIASNEEADPSNTFRLQDAYHTLVTRWTRYGQGTTRNDLQVFVGWQRFEQQIPLVVALDIPTTFVGVRDRLRYQFNDELELGAGAEFQFNYTDLTVVAPQLRRSGEASQGGGGAGQTRSVSTAVSGVDASLFSDLAWTPLRWLRVVPGVRGDYYGTINNWSADPRLTIRATVNEKPVSTTLKLGVGKYSKAPQPQFSAPGYGNPELAPEYSWQYSFGIEQQITDLLSIDVTGYYIDQYRLASTNPAASLDFTQPTYISEGRGRSYGMEVQLRHQPNKWFSGWISYTLARSERLFPGDTEYRLFNFDQPHNLAVVLLFTLPYQIDVGFRFRYVSGNPGNRINRRGGFDVDGSEWLTRAQDRSTERLPAVHTLDIRIDKTFVFNKWLFTVYIDVLNVYNRQNIEGISYSYDFSQSDYFRGLPIIPSLGFIAEF